MPELPEVETTRRGIETHIVYQSVKKVMIRNHQLRWPIPEKLEQILVNQQVHSITRRGKYLLLTCDKGWLIIHLGMSGKLRVLPDTTPASKHDHCDIIFNHNLLLRFNDPRRFGAILWTTENPKQHVLLKSLGAEPLTSAFNGKYLYQITRSKSTTIKQMVMDGKIVVGVGNIYASESLFLAKILPTRFTGTLSFIECTQLVQAIKQVLRQAIKAGGTTLKDFLQADGKPGYFTQQLCVYGRENSPCVCCQTLICSIKLGQRSTYFCTHCQQ